MWRTRFAGILRRVSAEPRRRHALAAYRGQRGRRLDGAISSIYFNVTAREWRWLGNSSAHLAPFTAGLERCRTPGRALDLGCGTGGSTVTLAQRYPQAEVVGVDGASRMVRLARDAHVLPNLTFLRARFQQLPFADGEFDLVTSLNALPDPGELGRVSSSDAELLIANSYFALMPQPLLDPLAELGFHRVAAEDLGEGSWQLFRRNGDR